MKNPKKNFTKAFLITVLSAVTAVSLLIPASASESTVANESSKKAVTEDTALGNTPISYGTGIIEVDNVPTQSTGYIAYQIFKANKNADGTMSNFAWISDEERDAVLAAIKAKDPTYTSLIAQDAADFISAAYKDASGQMTTDQTTILENKELLNQIAINVAPLTIQKEMTANTPTTLDEGWWLIITKPDLIETDEDGTSPIFAISSGAQITITEKTTTPTVDKVVKNDADDADWTYGADAQREQSVLHKVTGTIAKNIATYETYYYGFEDVMSKGIDFDESYIFTESGKNYRVVLDGTTDVSDSFTLTYTPVTGGDRTLTCICTDLKSITKATVKGSSTFEFYYATKLNADCVIGGEGNPNDVRIQYSSNPNTTSKQWTHKVRDYLFTYELNLRKYDRETIKALSGAKFTIKATTPDDTTSKNKYVQADGTLGDTAYNFTTDSNGQFSVSGLDVGTYTLEETSCPTDYAVVNKTTTFTIAATYETAGTLKTLTNTVSDNADACAGQDTILDTDSEGRPANIVQCIGTDDGTQATASTGVVVVTVGNIKKILIPLSGSDEFIKYVCIGGAILLASLAAFLISRKKHIKAD